MKEQNNIRMNNNLKKMQLKRTMELYQVYIEISVIAVGKSDIETSNLEKESKNKQKNKASSTGKLTRKKVSFIGSEDVRAYGRVGSKSSYSEQEKSNNDIVMSSHSTTTNSVRGMSNSKGSRTYAEACSTNNIKQANPMK